MLKLLLSLMLATLLLGTASAQEMGAAMIAYDEGTCQELLGDPDRDLSWNVVSAIK